MASRGKFKGGLSGRRGGRGTRQRGGVRKGGLFNLNFDKAKSYFFDVQDWTEILEPAEYQLLWKIGMDLMEQGRRLIKARKKPSRKGSSPSSWGSHKLKKSIFYGVDLTSMTVFAGPIKFDRNTGTKAIGQPTIPAVLQFGGKMWNSSYAPYDPPRVRNKEGLPAGRVVKIAPRPYMDKAYKQKKKKIERMTQNMLGKSPVSVTIADNKARTGSGQMPL